MNKSFLDEFLEASAHRAPSAFRKQIDKEAREEKADGMKQAAKARAKRRREYVKKGGAE